MIPPALQRFRTKVLGPTVTDVRTVVWTGGSMLIAQFLMAAHGILAARALGPEGKGLVTALTTWAQVLSWAALAGLGTASSVRVATLANDPEGQTDVLRAALGNAIAFAVTVGGTVLLVASLTLPDALAHLGPDTRSLTLLALTAIPLGILANVTWAVQLSLGRSHLFNWAQLLNPVVMVVMTVGFIATVGLTPGLTLLSAVCGAVVSFAVATSGLPWRRVRVSLRDLRRDLNFGIKVHLGGLFRLANYRLDYLVMSATLPVAQLGIYGAANSFMLPLATIPAAVAVLLTPKVARLASARDPGSALAQRQIALISAEACRYTLLALVAGIAVAALSPMVVPLLLGNAFRSTVGMLWILTPGYVLFCFSTVVAAGAAGMGRPWVVTTVEGAAIVVTAILLPLLLPRFDARGAAITSSVAYTVSAGAAAICLRRMKKDRLAPGTVDRSLAVAPAFPSALAVTGEQYDAAAQGPESV